MPKATIAKKVIHEDLSGVTIEFTDGSTLTTRLDELSPEIVTQLALHGLTQKKGDSYAGEQDVTVARGKAQAVKDRLVAGDWKAVREGGGGGRISDLAQALAEITGRTVEEAVTIIEGMEKADKAGLRKHPKVKVKLRQLELARAEAAAEKAGDDVDLPI